MLGFFSPKRTPVASYSRNFRPRLEALEVRFLLSTSPTLGPAFDRVLTGLALQGIKDVVLPDGKILVGGTATVGYFASPSNLPPLSERVEPIFPISEIEIVCFNADGSLDTAFGNHGIVAFQPGVSNTFSDFAVEPDGSFVVVGTNSLQGPRYTFPLPPVVMPFWSGISNFSFVPQDYEILVAHFNVNGMLDKAFNDGYVLTSLGGQSHGLGVAVQPDGKVIVSGQIGDYGNNDVVVRYNTDGSLDTGFNPNGAQPGIVPITFASTPWGYGSTGAPALALQSDGKIVLATAVPWHGLHVFRLNADGSLDAGFGSAGQVTYDYPAGTSAMLAALTIQPDGKILIAEDAVGLQGELQLLRFDTDGSLDSGFGQGGIATFGVGTGSNAIGWMFSTTGGLLVQPDGKIVVARATPQNPQNTTSVLSLVRFNTDGSLDSTFGTNGEIDKPTGPIWPGFVDVSASVTLAANGSLIVVGSVRPIFPPPFLEIAFPAQPVYELGQTLPLLELIDFGNVTTPPPPIIFHPPGVTPVSAPVQPRRSLALTPTSLTASDTIFQSLASEPGPGNSATVVVPQTPLHASAITTPLPIPILSQSEVVARLSGGGGEANAPGDIFGLVSESDRDGSLVLAGEAGAVN